MKVLVQSYPSLKKKFTLVTLFFHTDVCPVYYKPPSEEPSLPCQKDIHSTSSRSTVGQVLAYSAKMKWKWKDRLKSMGLQNLSHFEEIQSERSCGKFMFQAGSGINPCQHQHDSMSVGPNAKQKKPGTSQSTFPLAVWHSLAQSSISPCCRQNRKTYSLSMLSTHF